MNCVVRVLHAGWSTQFVTGCASKGAPRLVLHTASKNVAARQFFAALGFRETMVELTAEL